MEKLYKLMAKKKKEGHGMSDVEHDAKKSVLDDLQNLASDSMGSKLKKVTVASDSSEGVEKGLDKAKELLSNMHGDDEINPKLKEGTPEHEALESPEEEAKEQDEMYDNPHSEHLNEENEERMEHDTTAYDHLTPDEIEKEILKLHAAKAKKK